MRDSVDLDDPQNDRENVLSNVEKKVFLEGFKGSIS